MFLSEEDKGGKSGSLFGIALLTTNLVFDGAAVSTQDAIFRKFKLSGSSMMVYLNLSSGLLISSWLVIGHFLPSPYNSSELSNGIKFCLEHPRVFFDIIIFGFMGGIGQCFIFHTMERFGGVLLVTINVTRKMFSILLSAFYFQHVFSLGQWFSVFLVFVGIFLESFGKRFSGGEHVSEKVDTGKKEKKN